MTLLQTEELFNTNDISASNNVHLCESALLKKLEMMVPIMPRERVLSKLEVINYVIEYIRELKELVYLPKTIDSDCQPL